MTGFQAGTYFYLISMCPLTGLYLSKLFDVEQLKEGG